MANLSARKSLALLDNEYEHLETDLLNPEFDKDAILRVLNANTGDWLTAIDNTSRILKWLGTESGYIRKHARYLYDNAKAMEERDDMIRQAVIQSMIARGEHKLKFGSTGISISIRELEDEITIEDETLVPAQFKVAVWKVDMTKVKEHIKQTGEMVDGINIMRNRKTVVIR